MGLNRCPGGVDLQAEGGAGQVWGLAGGVQQLQQALDGLRQVMVWYQLAGLQGSVAKSQCLAHKRKQNTAAVRLTGESKADLYNNITENWIATQSA